MTKEIQRNASVGNAFNRGLDIYKKNFVPLLVATLLAVLIGGVTCGICSAPLFCGLFAMIFAVVRGGGALQIGDVFKGFQKFAPAFVSCLVLSIIGQVVYLVLAIIPVIGWILLLPACAAIGAAITWALLIVTDQDSSIGDAIGKPLKLLGDKRFWSFVLVSFLASIVGCLGAIACGIGIFFTLPFYYCMCAAAYEEMVSGSTAAPELTAGDEPQAS